MLPITNINRKIVVFSCEMKIAGEKCVRMNGLMKSFDCQSFLIHYRSGSTGKLYLFAFRHKSVKDDQAYTAET